MALIQSIIELFERMASQTDPVFAAALLLVVMALSGGDVPLRGLDRDQEA